MMDKYKKFLYQIELNTIAVAMGHFSDSLRDFHKFFAEKYPQIFQNFVENLNLTENNQQENKELVYKIPFEKPEVISNIAESLNEALNIYISNLNNSNGLLNAINNDNKFFSKKNVSMLIVINENERNVYDLRSVENLLYKK